MVGVVFARDCPNASESAAAGENNNNNNNNNNNKNTVEELIHDCSGGEADGWTKLKQPLESGFDTLYSYYLFTPVLAKSCGRKKIFIPSECLALVRRYSFLPAAPQNKLINVATAAAARFPTKSVHV